MKIQFDVNDDALAYVIEVMQAMQLVFGISEDEALGRVNRHWSGESFNTPERVDALTHELPEDMAKFIYYEPGTLWWIDDEPRRVRPYP